MQQVTTGKYVMQNESWNLELSASAMPSRLSPLEHWVGVIGLKFQDERHFQRGGFDHE
jgi:hypothetical protein